MATLAIWTGENKGPGQPEPGDVIDVFPDDQIFSKKELESPAWRLVRMPNISRAEAVSFMGGPLGKPGEALNHFRSSYLDLSLANNAELDLDFTKLNSFRRLRGV